jgi:hypothetical protein
MWVLQLAETKPILGRLQVSAISQNQPEMIEIKGLKTSRFKESKTAPLDREEIGSLGMSNVLKVSLQTTIYKFTAWPIVDGRSDELRVSWGSIAKRYAGICGWQNGHFDRRL